MREGLGGVDLGEQAEEGQGVDEGEGGGDDDEGPEPSGGEKLEVCARARARGKRARRLTPRAAHAQMRTSERSCACDLAPQGEVTVRATTWSARACECVR